MHSRLPGPITILNGLVLVVVVEAVLLTEFVQACVSALHKALRFVWRTSIRLHADIPQYILPYWRPVELWMSANYTFLAQADFQEWMGQFMRKPTPHAGAAPGKAA